MKQSLFRPEALRQQGERLWGDLLLSQPLSSTVIGWFLGALTALALWFLFQHDYARKQTVSGMLVPDRGLLEIRAPATGNIAVLAVGLDQRVARGTELFTLQLDHTDSGGAGLTGRLLQEVAEQQQALERQQEVAEAENRARASQFGERAVFLASTLRHQMQRLATASELLELRRRAVARAAELQARGLLARADLDTVQGQLLQQQGLVHELELQCLQVRSEQAALRTEQETSLLAHQRAMQQLAAELAELQKQRLRLGAEQGTAVLAPANGRITSMLRQSGMNVTAQEQVLAMLPDGAQLEVELLLPSSAIGFIRAGQPVKVRYDAFPYQKFGVQQARVSAVSASAVLVSAPRNGAALAGGTQPLYRVLATPDHQSISAYGNAEPLRPGMTLSADVVLERRSLLEWLLEPLFSMRGKR